MPKYAFTYREMTKKTKELKLMLVLKILGKNYNQDKGYEIIQELQVILTLNVQIRINDLSEMTGLNINRSIWPNKPN